MVFIKKFQALQAQIPTKIKIVGVSKYVSGAEIRELYNYGLKDFAESKVQAAMHKQAELADLPDITWHLIGNLQSNKVLKALQTFRWIHSIDSQKLLQKINFLAGINQIKPKPKVLLQIKLLPDPTKQGLSEVELMQVVQNTNAFINLELTGLMTILPKGCKNQAAFEAFNRLAQLKNQINELQIPGLQLTELSMGMSEDYQEAIQAGSTILRLGRAIFEA